MKKCTGPPGPPTPSPGDPHPIHHSFPASALYNCPWLLCRDPVRHLCLDRVSRQLQLWPQENFVPLHFGVWSCFYLFAAWTLVG